MGGGRGIACEGIEYLKYLFSMLFFIRGSVIFEFHKQVTNDTLGLEFFEIRYEDADNRRAYPCS